LFSDNTSTYGYHDTKTKTYFGQWIAWKLSGGERVMEGQKGRGRGFASMSPEKKREIASKGGKAAHALGTAHKWTSEEAQAAGRKGGSISRRRSKYSIQA
jgi:general stress protein YciG